MPPADKPQPSLRARALRLLARREHTRAELEAKLAGEDVDRDELAPILDDFSRRGWISEARVVEQVTHARRDRYGSRRIEQELAAKGVPEELIAEARQNLKATEVDAARGVWRRKFRAPPSNAAERARQLRFLQSRGFSLEIAMRVVREGGARHDDD